EWCDERQFVDGQLATESKLIAFLQTELIDKGCRNRNEPYTVNTLKLHVAAITDLWKQQVDFGINPHPRPRTDNVQAILNTYSINAHERKRQIYADRGAGSNNSEGMLKIAGAALSWQDKYGDRIQGLLDFLLGNYMLLRGDNTREIELADLFHIDQEPFPVLRSNEEWFDTKLFVQYAPRKRATDRTTAIDYKNTQMKWTNRMFSEANILSTKKTHAGRKAGAQMAKIRGVGESQIRRAGRWNRDEMTSCYLTSLPFKCIKAMSGLSPKGDFYIARAQITPPLELRKKIFPAVDYWLSRYYGPPDTENLETSIAGHGFLKLMEYLRETFADLPLWHHELFSDPMFIQWEQHFWELYREPDSARVVSTRLQNVIRDIATSISSLHDGIATKVDAVHQAVTQGIERLNSAVAHSQQETRQLSSRISVMETGFNYIFHGESLVTAAAANSSPYHIRSVPQRPQDSFHGPSSPVPPPPPPPPLPPPPSSSSFSFSSSVRNPS
ncbi:hypothetical protein V1519DRAFT_463264, partial [Lipomyces tetrasporus]